MIKITAFLIGFLILTCESVAQIIPGELQNIEGLVTFGKDSKTKFTDNDFSQTIYFVIREPHADTFHLRIFDPETSGTFDYRKNEYNSITKFEIYGGKGTYWDGSISSKNKITGQNLLYQKEFGNSSMYDDKWYTLCSLPVSQGEYNSRFDGYIFKIICKGISGDDGNFYKFYLSQSEDKNVSFDNSNFFCYQMICLLNNNTNTINHFFPYFDTVYNKLEIGIFGWNEFGMIRVNSFCQIGIKYSNIKNFQWNLFEYTMIDREEFNSLNVSLINNDNSKSGNQIVSIRLIGNASKYLVFFSDPLGGFPAYRYKIGPLPIDN